MRSCCLREFSKGGFVFFDDSMEEGREGGFFGSFFFFGVGIEMSRKLGHCYYRKFC